MYRLKEIGAAMANVVGWDQSYNPANAIDEKLTVTESGLTFQDAHPLCTLENVKSIMPDDFGYQYPNWVAGTYDAGDIVNNLSGVWQANKQTSDEPKVGATDWDKYNLLNDYLRTLTNSGINKVIQEFVKLKTLDRETRNLLDSVRVYDGSGRYTNDIQNTGKVVGFEIVPLNQLGITTKIEKIGLQMKGGTGKVRVYLFHTSQVDPIQTADLDFTVTNGGFQWFTVKDWFLPYMGAGTNAGGSWYLCYNQNDLPAGMTAINANKDWSREPCGTCNQGSIDVWRQVTKYIQLSPFMTTALTTFDQFPELWPNTQTMYTNATSYGMNVEMTVGCDLTDFFIQQRNIFANVIQGQVATNMLRALAMNPEVKVNRNQSNASKMDILYELDGNTTSPRPGGLGYELKKAYQSLRLDMQGMSHECLGCRNNGVRYKST